MSPTKIASRGMKPLKVVRGFVPGWSLLFNHRGGFGNIETVEKIQAGQLDVTRLSPPSDVHGVLVLLSREEFAKLAWEEYAYNTVEVPVQVYAEDQAGVTTGKGFAVGDVQHVLAFKTSQCAEVEARTLPSRRYVQLLQEGAHTSSLDLEYCSWLNAIPPA